ncbi:sensor histidine kinase [Erythrobacter sp. JK5]|uniref:sensor histidine kinase n=1 Tax=Erythrobacter sp. JK5 TaxID=2829500 RepID=UPI001BA4B04C|nr:sensor histidine kinase [Erythrobacter sp. JK5]QUL37638.1 sensor histidine kinase [Erythrobacter sp. JK5]
MLTSLRQAAALACFVFASVLAIANVPHARTEPLPLIPEAIFYADTKPHLTVLRDSTGRKSASEVAALGGEFEPIDSDYVDFGLTEDMIWLKFSAKNLGDKPQIYRIDMKRQYFEELRLFEIEADGELWLLLGHRQEDDFTDRPIPSRFLLADVRFEAGESKTFLIGYRSSTTTFLPLAVGTIDGVNAVHQAELTTDLFLNGMLAAMVVYSLLMLPVIGWRLAASFAGYIGAGAFYVLVADGYPMQSLWPDRAWMNEPMNLVSMLAMTALGLNFCRQLFQFNEFAMLFDRILVVLLGLTIACVVLAFALIEYDWFTIPAYLLPPIANLAVCAAGIVAWRKRRIGALPFLFGALLVASSLAYATVAHLVPGRFDLDATLDYGHVALLGECVAFALAILLRFLSIRAQRDLALAQKLEESEQRLKLSEELVDAQRNYAEARSHAERGQRRLSDMSHDIRQPLLILRDAIAKLSRHEGEDESHLRAAVAYLEDVTTVQATALPEAERGGNQRPEKFALQILFNNIAQLFSERAAARGIELKIRPTELEVTSHPVSLMRIIGNLTENAIVHGKGDKVLLAARRRGSTVRIEVWDRSEGLSSDEVESAMQRGVQGEKSPGSGLGLDIVARLCRELGHRFELRSRKGRGSVAIIHLIES